MARKGVDHAIDIVKRARDEGARITFDIIGTGECRAALEAQVARQDLAESVRFLGQKAYDSTLLADLASYDALLFTPLAEDTPRMIFDGYAAGLPLLGYGIPYVVERADEEGATEILPFKDVERSADILVRLDRDRDRLAELGFAAHRAAHLNSAEAWYRQRARWTLEAHTARQARPG